jgi:hypothetical protein
MNRHFVRKAQSLSFVVLFAATITILATLAALAQVRDANQRSGKAAVVSASAVTARLAQASGDPLLPVAASRGQREKSGGGSGGGSPTFLPAVLYNSGGDQPAFVTAADVNGDGKLDLLVGNSYYSNSIGVLLGKGDGTFGPVATYDSGGGMPTGIVAIDINGDGKIDLIVFNETPCYACSGDGTVAVLLGRGDGTFGPPTTYDSGGAGYGVIGPTPMVVIDVNNDGKPDVVVANCSLDGGNCGDGDGEVGVLLGNGDGTFRPVVAYDTRFHPGGNGLAVGDVNGDGKPDLIVTSACDTQSCPLGKIGVLLGNGDGTFQRSVKYELAGYSALGIAVADLNHDGKLDVVVGGCLTGDCLGQEGVVTVLLGNGDGTFQPPVGYGTVGGFTDGVAVADVNGDGKPDVVVMNYDGSVAVLQGNGDGTFLPAVTFASGITDGAYGVGVADLNGDGWPDVMMAGNTSLVSVLINSTGALASTTTSLVSSLNPAVPNQTVTYTATVTSQNGPATGTITFQDGGATIATVTVSGNQGAYSLEYGRHGTHQITATYSGDSNNGGSTSPTLTELILHASNGHAPTRTSLSASGSFILGQSVTFSATVTSLYGPIPDGDSVQFFDGNQTLGFGATLNGVASITATLQHSGSNVFQADYEGDTAFKSSAGFLKEFVDKNPTATSLVSSLNPAVYGQPITYTAAVTSSGPAPEGSVKITDIGLVPLVNGVATVTKTLVRTGTHAITAEYMGDSSSAKSTSPVLEEVVNPASTTTVLTSSANPSSSGQSVTFTATVTSSTGVDPFGKVTFTAGGVTLGTVSVTDTVAKISTATLPVGSTTITATYGGADSFTGSSASLTQVVQP